MIQVATVSSRSTNAIDSIASEHPHVPTAPFRWLPGELIFDDIVLREKIGEGGMGTVYRASHVVTQQEFAVKRVRSATAADPATQRKFYAELVSWLDVPKHPQLLACNFFRTVAGELAIFTDFMSGGSVAGRISTAHPLLLPEVIRIGLDVGVAAAMLHARNLVHQDIKPANVLLDGSGAAKLGDFGLARAATFLQGSALDSASALATWRGMTRAYCSPEQAERLPLSTASDVFSWAATMVHMLVGRVSWKAGPELTTQLRSILLDGKCANVPNTLIKLLQACLDRDAPKRPPMALVVREISTGCGGGEDHPVSVGNLAEMPQSDRIHDYQTHVMTSRIMIGPVYWQLRAKIDLGDSSDSSQLEARSAPAQLARDIDEYRRFAQLYRRDALDRPELKVRLRQLLVEMALAQDEAGDIQGAAESIKEAISLVAPQRNDARETMDTGFAAARILNKLGRYREIVEILQPIVENNPFKGDPLICRMTIQIGNAFSDLAEFGEAYSWYGRALSMIPPSDRYPSHALTSAQIHHEMAVLHRRSGENGAALKESEEVLLKIGGDDIDSAAQRGITLWLQGTILTDMDRHDEAIVAYDGAIIALAAVTGKAGPSLDIEAAVARARMSRSISLHKLGRSSEALVEVDQVIELRKMWYASQARPEFADELARAYSNKALILQESGDIRSSLDCLAQAYGILKQVQETGRRDVRREMAFVMGSLGEQFWMLGAEDQSRKLLPPATFLTEQLLSELPKADNVTRFRMRTTLVTRYYQLSRLAENSPDSEQRNARESLLDMTLGEATAFMAEGAPTEVLHRYFEAAKDKAILLSARGDATQAEKLISDLRGLYDSLSGASKTQAEALEFLPDFLLAGGVWALISAESSPKRGLAVIDDVLQAVPNVTEDQPELLDRVALTWLARSRICRGFMAGEIATSAERAFQFWRLAVSQTKNPVFLSQATYFASEHIDWCRRSGQEGLARRGAFSMLEILQSASAHSGREDLAQGVASWREHYSLLLK
jgi:serine/threonine protein kinase